MRSKKRKALKDAEQIAHMTPAERHRHMMKKHKGIRAQIARANGERFDNGGVASVDTYRAPYALRAKRGRTADAKQK